MAGVHVSLSVSPSTATCSSSWAGRAWIARRFGSVTSRAKPLSTTLRTVASGSAGSGLSWITVSVPATASNTSATVCATSSSAARKLGATERLGPPATATTVRARRSAGLPSVTFKKTTRRCGPGARPESRSSRAPPASPPSIVTPSATRRAPSRTAPFHQTARRFCPAGLAAESVAVISPKRWVAKVPPVTNHCS